MSYFIIMAFVTLVVFFLIAYIIVYIHETVVYHNLHVKLYGNSAKRFNFPPLSILLKNNNNKIFREIYIRWLLENTIFGDVIMISNNKINIDPLYIIMNDLKQIRREFIDESFKYYIKKDHIGKDVVVIVSNNIKMSNDFEASKLKQIIESSLYFYNISHIKREHSFSKESLKIYINEIKELTDFEIEDEEKMRSEKELIEKKTNIINSTDTVENKQIQLKRLNIVNTH